MHARTLPPSLARSCELACWREASGIADPPHASGRCSARACRERSLCPAELQEPRSKPALTHVVVVAARFGQYPKANRTLDTVRKIVSSQAAVLRRVLPKGSSTVLFVDNATPSLAGEVLRRASNASSWCAALHARLLGPLGLNRTYCHRNEIPAAVAYAHLAAVHKGILT